MKTDRFFQTEYQASSRRAILVGVHLSKREGGLFDEELEELDGLATTAHYEPVATLTQRLPSIHPKTFMGSGKVDELAEAVNHHEADVVIFDESLSPAQNKNLESALKCRVIDRSWLILEIFSDHARTRESKTQVELARLKYALPRLTKMWGHLSRQRGGIGLKDVGETQIQLDRRLIRNDIHKLERKLKQIDKEKVVQRKQRRDVFKVALVGYTNVGKSSLMNTLTEAETLVENKLFATLDATTRKVKKNFPFPVLLSDTVGLIKKLPHDLVASFKSTLDEVREADFLLKVTDLSHPEFREQMETTDELLKELGVDETPSLLVFNKADRIRDEVFMQDLKTVYPNAVFISCKTGMGMERLRAGIVAGYEKQLTTLNLHLEFSQANLLPKIHKLAMVVAMESNATGWDLDLRVDPSEASKLQELVEGNGNKG